MEKILTTALWILNHREKLPTKKAKKIIFFSIKNWFKYWKFSFLLSSLTTYAWYFFRRLFNRHVKWARTKIIIINLTRWIFYGTDERNDKSSWRLRFYFHVNENYFLINRLFIWLIAQLEAIWLSFCCCYRFVLAFSHKILWFFKFNIFNDQS